LAAERIIAGPPMSIQDFAQRVARGADGDIGVVLGGGADHRRAADVDVLHARLEARAGGRGLLERVEVDPQKVDALDRVLAHGAGVIARVPHAQKAAVDLRMQRLDSAVHHLRKAGDL
jgi:hypothetical protein